MISNDFEEYNQERAESDKSICLTLAAEITSNLSGATHKVWHGHPVWFLRGNPIVGYSKQKRGIRLMFWSGQGFEEEALNVRGKKFRDASIFYNDCAEIDVVALRRWITKAQTIQWDYKNLIKNKGKLVQLS